LDVTIGISLILAIAVFARNPTYSREMHGRNFWFLVAVCDYSY
jgi:hypothetical protein